MRVLFSSLRNIGHFQPLVPFISGCLARGHEVAVAAPADLAERVARSGAQFLPFGHPGDEGLRPTWQALRELPEAERGAAVMRELFAGVCAKAALPELLRILDTFQPDIIVRESQEYAALLGAEKLRINHARIAIMLESELSRQALTVAPALDVHRIALGLAGDPEARRILDEPVLTLFPPGFSPAYSEQVPMLRFRAPTPQPAPLPDWWPGDQRPLLYLTLGTVTGGMADLESAYRLVLEAVAPLPMRVLLTIGRELAPERLGALPANVHLERFVPQDDVLPHATLVVCHGGSGTVIGTLAAGLPMVILPLFADQPMNAARVQQLGAGLAVAQSDTAADIRAAVQRVLMEPSYRRQAAQLALEVGALPPIEDAAKALEQLSEQDGQLTRGVQ